MDGRFLAPVRSYQAAATAALAELLARSGVSHPFDWREAGLPLVGTLPGNPPLHYQFHGAGPAMHLGDRPEVDFDFGHDGRTTGFNGWWLRRFAEDTTVEFLEFREKDAVATALEDAIASGEVVQSFRERQDDLWYLMADVADEQAR
jgi:hypothetical protein